MGPRKFFEQAALEVGFCKSRLLVGPVGTSQDIATHHMAIVSNRNEFLGLRDWTVLTADRNPSNDSITSFKVMLHDQVSLQPESVHIGEDSAEALRLHNVQTAMGAVGIELYTALESGGVYDGLVHTERHGSLIAQLYTFKHPDETAYRFKADDYARFDKDQPA